ncbi:hypothetical protein [Sphingomonas sp. Leaf22]|uniref:hypothetical protein n=1 Tax=Sphingomonas sp. Leaf22 TaxID=1735687 RepID=UPI000A5A98A2|nr:hypothetical protein [Sphingomonas sp. Leaf22]
MTRATTRRRDTTAGCFVCHGDAAFWTSANAQALAAQHHDRTGHQTWCRIAMSVTYGSDAGDDRQIDIEDAIASASSGGRPEAAPLTDPDAPADALAGVSAHEGRPVETRRLMPRGARGRKPETIAA